MVAAEEAPRIDLYGPFLQPEQILYRPNPEIKIATILTLGDFALQVDKRPFVTLHDHERFILNFLLSLPDGEAPNADFYAAGYFPDAAHEGSRQASMSLNTDALMRRVNHRFGQVVDKRKIEGTNKIKVVLANDVYVERVADDEVLEQREVEEPLRPRLHVVAPQLAVAEKPKRIARPLETKRPKPVAKTTKPTAKKPATPPKQPAPAVSTPAPAKKVEVPVAPKPAKPRLTPNPRPQTLGVSDQNFKPRVEKHVPTETEILAKKIHAFIDGESDSVPWANDYARLQLIKRQLRQAFEYAKSLEQKERFALLSQYMATAEERLTHGIAYREGRGYSI